MNFWQAIKLGFLKYTTFSGRAARSEYWYWILFCVLTSTTTQIIDVTIFSDARGFFPLNLISSLLTFLPSLAVMSRRLHDIDRTGKWILLLFTGFGVFVLIYWACQKGTAGSNRFGPRPTSVNIDQDPKTPGSEPPNKIDRNPPPIPNTNTIEWYYEISGTREGPVSEETIKKLLNQKAIDAETSIWCKGMADWKSIRESNLSALVASEPPPLTPDLISNVWVWLIAFLPLATSIVDVTIIEAKLAALPDQGAWERVNSALGGVLGLGAFPTGLPWYAYLIPLWVFAILDERTLRRAGYSSSYMPLLALFLIPVYLFVRAKRLKQTSWYGFVWILCLILGIWIEATP